MFGLKSASVARFDAQARMILESGLFHRSFYEQQTGLSFKSPWDAAVHYLSSDLSTRKDPHPLVSLEWYRSSYPDIVGAGVDPLSHFLEHGSVEGRDPTRLFDTDWYLAQYPDVRAAGINPLTHYLTDGAAEGRNPSASFDSRAYLEANPDVAKAGMNPLIHYVQFGARENRRLRPLTVMDEAFSLQNDLFDLWRHRVFAKALLPTRDYRGKLVVLIASSEGIDACSSASGGTIADTGETLVMVVSCPFPVDMATLAVNDEDLLLIVGEGDVIDDAALRVARQLGATLSQLITFDMFYRLGAATFPILQPGANEAYLRSVDGTFSRFAIRGGLFRLAVARQASSPRTVLLAALDVLRENNTLGAFAHAPYPLVETPPLSEVIRTTRRTLQSLRPPAEGARRRCRVSTIICTKDNGRLVDHLLAHLTNLTAIEEVIVVSNQTTNPFAMDVLARWNEHPRVEVIDYSLPFNFSAQCNLAAKQARGDALLFLNDDIVPLDDLWLDHMLDMLDEPGIGAVGPLLLYPDERVQHAGMHLGFHHTAGHTLRRATLPQDDYLFMASANRDVSCVTGAALLVHRSIFDDLNGFDEQLASIYQDVDLCLRMRDLGQRIVFAPGATLLHMESISILTHLKSQVVLDQRLLERSLFLSRHGTERLAGDEFLNPNFEPFDESLMTLKP